MDPTKSDEHGAPARSRKRKKTKKKPKAKKESRIQRYKRHARQIHEDPKNIGAIMRDGLVSVWRARGGGFYGLGYLITFIVLEVRLVVGDVTESEGVVDFISSQMIEFVFRFGIQSFVNGFLAFLWPVYVLDWLGTWSIALLVGGYYAFEKLLRPAVEGWLPDLRPEPSVEEDKEVRQ